MKRTRWQGLRPGAETKYAPLSTGDGFAAPGDLLGLRLPLEVPLQMMESCCSSHSGVTDLFERLLNLVKNGRLSTHPRPVSNPWRFIATPREPPSGARHLMSLMKNGHVLLSQRAPTGCQAGPWDLVWQRTPPPLYLSR